MPKCTRHVMNLLKSPHIDLEALRHELDAATHAERLITSRMFTPALQQRLYEAVEGQRVCLDHMVPLHYGPSEEVIHEGVNTLPVFRHFQKRFCRPSTQHTLRNRNNRAMIWGFNEQAMRPFSGPGYFVGYEDEASGEFWIDYNDVPPERAQGWPYILSNKQKLGIFIYANMIDKMRGVSKHMTIGRAFKHKPMNAWFTLVRVP